MSYVLDSLTKNDDKRRENRPLSTLLPQGNRASEKSRKPFLFAILTLCALALIAAMLWFLNGSIATQYKNTLLRDDSLIRQLEIESSLANSNNITIEKSSILTNNLRSPDSPSLITSIKNKIKESSTFIAQPKTDISIKEPIDTTKKVIKETTTVPAKETANKKQKEITKKEKTAAIPNNKVDTGQNKEPEKTVKQVEKKTQTQKSKQKPQDKNYVAAINTKTTTKAVEAPKTVSKSGSTISDTLPNDFDPPDLSALIYSKTPQKRFVMLDGVIYNEGDKTIDNLLVVEIQKERIVLEKNGDKFYYERK